ncbi:MAG: hypothetical protein KA339_00070 [Candidatus Kapabacteria bacterium]|nr:hypothetical protein [Ignavibacteria bacterium]MBK6420208.1 hypothetical protein [Ignavibacteria bacterium]MBK7412844.1 hypothetical protein [Ignavibacteria bacterium]MBP6508922.1 hypothetical protein [Candidatus Kapabacteria bacterium]MBP7093107.1 hypothetical protein [Candidatus Kapabacteria bacterium]
MSILEQSSEQVGPEEQKTDNGFVALLDVLGFGSMTEQRRSQVAAALEHAVDSLLPKLSEMMPHSSKERLKEPVVRMFSDTIIVAFSRIQGASVIQDMFHFVNDFLGMLFCLLMSDRILIRGSVGYGTIIERKYGIYGTAILDAKNEYEETSWASIHFTVAATSFIAKWHLWAMENGVSDTRLLPGTAHVMNRTQFYVSNVPFKSSHKFSSDIPPTMIGKRFVVPWPKDLRTVIESEHILAQKQTTSYTRIHEVMDVEYEHGSERVREIITNTLDFAEAYLARYPDVNRPLNWEGPLP